MIKLRSLGEEFLLFVTKRTHEEDLLFWRMYRDTIGVMTNNLEPLRKIISGTIKGSPHGSPLKRLRADIDDGTLGGDEVVLIIDLEARHVLSELGGMEIKRTYTGNYIL